MLDEIDFWKTGTEQAYRRAADVLVSKGAKREEAEELLYVVYQATREEYE